VAVPLPRTVRDHDLRETATPPPPPAEQADRSHDGHP